MLTMAQRLTKEGLAVCVRQGGGRRTINDPELWDAIKKSYALRRRLRTLDAELSEARSLIAKRAAELIVGGSTVSLDAGDVICTVTLRHETEIPEENVGRLRKLLGRRFKDLVRTKVRHLATSRLVAEGGEEALGLMRLRQLSPQFKWSERGASEQEA